MTTATESTSDNNDTTFSEVALHTMDHNGREIAYSTSPNQSLPPVLFFYPLGGNRRMLYSFRNFFSELYFICVNRPGIGGTSSAAKGGAVAQLDTALQDAAAVLDQLGVHKVSLMCMCAGTPFCLSFAAKYPQRTTGKCVGISSWIPPADCGYENTKTTFYLGTTLRPLVAPIAGMVSSSIGSSLSSFPASMTLSALRKGLSPGEQEAFDQAFQNTADFSKMMKWMQQENGNTTRDMSVLLSRNHVDYQGASASQESIVIWHGTGDKLVPFASVEWLVSDEALPDATLNAVPDGTHEGCNFLLHESIVNSIKTLGEPN